MNTLAIEKYSMANVFLINFYIFQEYTGPGEQEVEKPSKDEYKIAKWMKKNIKTKKTKFLSHNVEYFSCK